MKISFLVAISFLVNPIPARAVVVEGINIDEDHLDPEQTLNLLVQWGYFDEALRWQAKEMKSSGKLTRVEILSQKKSYLEKVEKYHLPPNTFPEIEEYTLGLSSGGEEAHLLVYCLKQDRAIRRKHPTWRIPQYIRLLGRKNPSINDDVGGSECQPKGILSTFKVPGETLLAVFEPGLMAEGSRFFHLKGGRLDPILRVEDNGKTSPLESVTPFHGPPFKDSFSTDGSIFSESKGTWDHNAGDQVTTTSLYEWDGSNYIILRRKITHEKAPR